MTKIDVTPYTMLVPLPAVLVTCGDYSGRFNVITISWCGIVCSQPPMLSISIRENRFSFNMIKQSGEFVVNITGAKLVKAVDYCGNNSGENIDKFKNAGLTPAPASKVKPPLIEESPVNLECQVRKILELGSHHAFIAEIVATHLNEDVLDEKGKLDIKKLDPLIYGTNARQYWSGLSMLHGYYGFTRGEK